MKKIISKLLQLVLLLITCTLLSLFLCFGLLQTPFGKRHIENYLVYTLHSYGIDAKIEGLSGLLPFECTFSHVTLSFEKQVRHEYVQEKCRKFYPVFLIHLVVIYLIGVN